MKHLILLSTFFFSAAVFGNYESYDEIVDKLSQYNRTTTSAEAYRPETRSFSRAHLGLGFAQTFFNANSPGINGSMQNQGGLLINIGVDVLNQRWGLEGSYSNFGSQNSDESQIRLREFALKGLYKPSINKNWTMRIGTGVSSRFLDVQNPEFAQSFRTPSALFVFGLDTYISQFISVGADLNFKTAMISDTIDNNSIDLNFRVDTHF